MSVLCVRQYTSLEMILACNMFTVLKMIEVRSAYSYKRNFSNGFICPRHGALMRKHNILSYSRKLKIYPTMPPDLALIILISSNYPCLEHYSWFQRCSSHGSCPWHRRDFVEEPHRNRINTVRNPNGTLANRRDSGFFTVYPGFAESNRAECGEL